MSVKDEVLKVLEKQKGTFFSGASLAEELGVSRAAVWKAIKSLKQNGYHIDSVTNKGYRLLTDNDIVSASSIAAFLDEKYRNLDIKVVRQTSSTNNDLKEMATAGATHGTILVAESQTAGKGRMGRSFYSPPGTGIYFSILLRPDGISASESLFFTTMAAVAVSKSVEWVKNCHTDIKWVNDVFLNGKKICGILTEGAFNVDTNSLDYAVVGIGINVTEPEGGFLPELKDIAGTVFTKDENSVNSRSKLVAGVINTFMDYYQHFSEHAFFDDYKARSFLLGQKIYVMEGEICRPATALDIDKDCHLLVRFEDGSEKYLFSGEVSIKLNAPKQ